MEEVENLVFMAKLRKGQEQIEITGIPDEYSASVDSFLEEDIKVTIEKIGKNIARPEQYYP